MNKLRTKIFLALAFLFLIIVALGSFGSTFIRRLATDSSHIIQDNYASAQYSTNMLRAINRIYGLHAEKDLLKHDVLINKTNDINSLLNEFDENLKKEEANVTEAGEIELVNELRKGYSDFVFILKDMNSTSNKDELKLKGVQLLDKYENLLNILNDIYRINTRAILRKNDQASQTAGKVSGYMLIISSVSAIVALLFILYLPKYLVRPIDELTAKIRKISEGNYNQQLTIHSNDELGELSNAFNTMSLRLKEYEENNIHKLLIEKKRLESVIDSLRDAIFVLDENKTIISANLSAFEIMNLTQMELLGKYAPDIAAGNDIMRELIKDLMTNGLLPQEKGNSKSGISPMQIDLKGKKLYFNKEISKINLNEDGSSRLIGYILLLKNITQFEERDTAKTDLIATVSHELKTPISSINLSIKLLENEKVGSTNEEQRHIIESMKQQTSRLSRMVNELLDYSQAESGNIKLRIEPVTATDIIDYAAVAMVMIIGEKKIQLDTKIEEDLPCMLADVEKTVWVLVNLINNAVRYTPENGTISITAQKKDNFVVIAVSDQGSGISAEDQEKIFHKFVKLGNQNPRGRGLGLAISKEFVISQGGDIWVESVIGEGSKFSFKLPAAEQK
ncbi:MAG: ATP-binding protein [Bacteroidota bacterium]|nr:ATP-binding protein [Bacteroidota bacterium]MDP4193518.1 ATP-binding protein [Bacteroidota bacterium]